jgi:hypothetical protein
MKSKNTFLFLASAVLIAGCSTSKGPLEVLMDKSYRKDTGAPVIANMKINVREDVNVNKILLSALDEDGKTRLDCFGDRTVQLSSNGIDGINNSFSHSRKNAIGEGYYQEHGFHTSAKDGLIRNRRNEPEPASLKAGDVLSIASVYCAGSKKFTIDIETDKGNFIINKDFES